MKYTLYLFAFSMSILFTSCGATIYEDIVIDEKGKGTYELHSDMIPAIRNMSYLMAAMKDNDSSAKKVIDSAEVERKIFEKFPDYIDSTINLKKDIDEKSKKDVAFMKVLNNSRMYMRGGKTLGKLDIGMFIHFDNIEEINQLSKLSKKKDTKKLAFKADNALFYFKNNELKKQIVPKANDSTSNMSKDKNFDLMFKDNYFITTIHTKRKIKKVISENIKMQNDTMVVLQVSLSDYMNGKSNENFSVIFE